MKKIEKLRLEAEAIFHEDFEVSRSETFVFTKESPHIYIEPVDDDDFIISHENHSGKFYAKSVKESRRVLLEQLGYRLKTVQNDIERLQ